MSLTRMARRGEQGFTLIEVIVAMVITLIVMTSLSYVVISSLKTIQQAKQRQSATALATQQLERLRAMPYDDVTLGSAVATVKPGLLYVNTTTGAPYYFLPPGTLVPGVSSPGERLVLNTVSGQWADQQVDQVTYRVHTYVTGPFASASGSPTYNVTAITQWTSNVWPHGRMSVERTTTFQPGGCLSSATSPFNAPCQVYTTARAGEALAGVSVSDPDDSQIPLLGTGTTNLQLGFPGASASFFVEQTANGTATSTATSSQIRAGQTVTDTAGGNSVKAGVDSDPSSTPNQSVTETLSSSGSGTMTVWDGDSSAISRGRLILTQGGGDNGGARAAIGADSSICKGLGNIGLATGTTLRPCASSNVQLGGTASTLDYRSPLGGGDVRLATFAQSWQSRAVSGVFGQSTASGQVCGGTTVPSGAPVDCVYAAAERTVGTVTFGVKPNSSPSGYPVYDPGAGLAWDFDTGLWQVTGLSETAGASDGVGGTGWSFARTGSLKVWTGDTASDVNGYTTVNLASWAAPATGSDPASVTLDLLPTQIQYSPEVSLVFTGKVTVQRPKASSVGSFPRDVTADCQDDACKTSVDGSAGVVSTIQVEVYINGTPTPWTRFAVVTDLGGLTADVSYKAATDA
jgi:prepilin-type N-terminal cleavage/methylation domain-containing protein